MMTSILLEPEKIYHIYNHANGHENLFVKEENYKFFLKKYGEHLFPYLETYAYCLLPNHFHLLIRVRNEITIRKYLNEHQLSKSFKLLESSSISKIISKQFSNFFSSYTQAFNKQQKRRGSLFMPNFKRKEINNDNYLMRVLHYIHFNPIKHGFVKNIENWNFTSYHSFFANQISKLEKEKVIDLFGSLVEFKKYHEQMPLWNENKSLDDC